MATQSKANPRILSAAATRSKLGEVLRRVKEGQERFLIQQGGEPQAIVMSIDDYVDAVAPAPNWLESAWKEAEKNGIDQLSSEEIEREINLARQPRRRPRKTDAA